MEFEKNNINLQNEENFESNLDFRELIEKYLRYWKWFVIAAILGVVFGYFYLNFQRSIYEATATIKIKNEQGGDRSALSAFQDLGIMTASNQNVEDEMEILLSKDLIAEVIKSLKLNIRFFTDKNSISNFLDDNLGFDTDMYERERYTDPPLKINFLISESELFETKSQFIVLVHSANNFTYVDKENEVQKKYSFGEKVSTHFGDIIITPNITDLKDSGLIGKSVLVVISSVRDLASAYAEKLEIKPISPLSSVLSLKIRDGVQQKSAEFLNELVNIYNERAIKLKEETTKSTSNFVSKRLEIISQELTDVDLDAELLKTRYKLSDVASETGLNMQSGQTIENQIVETNTQLEKIGFIKEFVETKEGDDLLPVDIGVADNNVSDAMQQYNQLMMEKKRLLKTSTNKNPIVVRIDEQLKDIKNNIGQGLANLESSQKISLDALNRQDIRINSRLYSAPRQERQLRDIQRQQQIKESLYLYLLQKREETAITLGVSDPNAKIIDSAESDPDPVYPKKLIIYLIFLFIGLLVPFVIIYLNEILDTKIHTREDVQKVLNVPIIGDIPKLESKTNYLIKKDDYSSIAEAFRILRTNLNFILPDSNEKKGKVIFVTSSIAHEGKSLIAVNLASAFAHAGKRTLILGLDIRAPNIKTYLGIRGKLGVTNYIINSEIREKDIVIDVPDIQNLDLISSGDIAPNPAELLMNPRLQDLFAYAKENYDFIIVDTAAYSMVTDTLLLISFADTFIYVIRANFLDKRMLKYINFLYKEKRLPNLALLINGIDQKKSNTYGYGYGYGSDFEQKVKKPWWKLIS